MKKATTGESSLSDYQLQAMRLNKLESRRLQRDIDVMNDNLRSNLARIQRQEREIRNRYANIVRLVKPNPSYQTWRDRHNLEKTANPTKNALGPLILQARARIKAERRVAPSEQNEVSTETAPTLLVALQGPEEEPHEVILNFSEHINRPQTSPTKTILPKLSNRERRMSKFPLKISMTPGNLMQTPNSEVSSSSQISTAVTSISVHSFPRAKPLTTKKFPRIDVLNRQTLKNKNPHKPIGEIHVEKCELINTRTSKRDQVLQTTIRPARTFK